MKLNSKAQASSANNTGTGWQVTNSARSARAKDAAHNGDILSPGSLGGGMGEGGGGEKKVEGEQEGRKADMQIHRFNKQIMFSVFNSGALHLAMAMESMTKRSIRT